MQEYTLARRRFRLLRLVERKGVVRYSSQDRSSGKAVESAANRSRAVVVAGRNGGKTPFGVGYLAPHTDPFPIARREKRDQSLNLSRNFPLRP